MCIESTAYARIGIIGNPSDGYRGKTISAAINNFCAKVKIEKNKRLIINSDQNQEIVYKSISALLETTGKNGFTPGSELPEAAIKVFYDKFCKKISGLGDSTFFVDWQSNIPVQSGLGGSSAIVTAVLKGMLTFFNVKISKKEFPNLILDVEQKELEITAGLQDRVAQVYEGITWMDFSRESFVETGTGFYEYLPENLLPPLFLVYREKSIRNSGEIHKNIRKRFDGGDIRIMGVMDELAGCAEEYKNELMKKNYTRMKELMDFNFNLRRLIFPVGEPDIRLINSIRKQGFCAKLAGSHNSIIGIYRSEEEYESLEKFVRAAGAVCEKTDIKSVCDNEQIYL